MEKIQPLPSTTAEGLFSSDDGSVEIDYAAERRLVRKLDVRLLSLQKFPYFHLEG
jgi:hypothetical protein